MSTADELLSDFIDAWNAGRRPRVLEYLARLPDGAERDALAERIDDWLELAPTPAYDEPTRRAIRAEPALRPWFEAGGETRSAWPAVLPRLRARAGVTETQLAERLVDRLGLAVAERRRAADYLEQLESGRLDPARVSRRLLGALGALLGVSARRLAELAAPATVAPAADGAAMLRSEPETAAWVRDDLEALSRAALTPAPPPMDELDRLFLGGPDA